MTRGVEAREASEASIDRFIDAVWIEDGLSANTLAASGMSVIRSTFSSAAPSR